MTEEKSWTRVQQPGKLPNLEVAFYTVIWMTSVAGAMYSISRFTSEQKGQFAPYSVTEGWSIFGGKKDNEDFELIFWRQWAFNTWSIYLGHIILGQIIRNFTFKNRQKLMILYDVAGLCWIISPQGLAYVALNALAAAVVAFVTRSRLAVWALVVAAIYVTQWEGKYQRHPFSSFVFKTLCNEDSNVLQAFRFSTYFSFIRILSFAHHLVDKLNAPPQASKAKTDSAEEQSSERDVGGGDAKVGESAREDKSGDTVDSNQNKAGTRAEPKTKSTEEQLLDMTFLDVVQYLFYLPTYTSGPILTFQRFNPQVKAPVQPWTAERIKPIALETLRVLFWAFVWDTTLHFIFFNCIQFSPYLPKLLSYWELAGVICAIVTFFYIKYIVIYGLTANVARLDQIEPPGTPTCVVATYKYSEDWRLFDRGLYEFLMRHIYFALGGSRRGPYRQVLAAVACFSFTCFWHGAMDFVIEWTAFNIFIVGAEAFAANIVDTEVCKNFERKYLSPAMVRRLSSLFWVPMRLLHTMATLIFIGGGRPAHIFIRRIFVEGFPTATLAIVVLYYTFVQVGMEAHRRRHARLDKTTKLKTT